MHWLTRSLYKWPFYPFLYQPQVAELGFTQRPNDLIIERSFFIVVSTSGVNCSLGESSGFAKAPIISVAVSLHGQQPPFNPRLTCRLCYPVVHLF